VRAFGVITTSGFAGVCFTCRRSRWKYCAAVVGMATRRFRFAHSVRNRSSRALECSGPWPSYPWGKSSTMPLAWFHFSCAEEMNWSMMICAPFAKSPNCASHSTRSPFASTE